MTEQATVDADGLGGSHCFSPDTPRWPVARLSGSFVVWCSTSR